MTASSNMSEIDIVCPRCRETLEASDEVRGSSIECPSCHANFVVPRDPLPPPIRAAPQSPAPPFPTRPGHTAPQRMSAVVCAGWICLGIGMLLLIRLLFIPIWAPLLLASLILGIIAWANGDKRGLPLLLASAVAPPVVGAMVFILFVGGCTAAVDSEMKRQGIHFLPPLARPAKPAAPAPSGKTNAPAVPTPPVQSTPTRVVMLGDVLRELDTFGQKFHTAQTSLQKDEIKRAAQSRAVEMMQNSQMTVGAVIADVRMPQEGVAQIFCHSLDLGAFGAIKDKALTTEVPGYVQVVMARKDALKLIPETAIHISGRPIFQPSMGNLLGNSVANRSTLLSLRFRIDGTILGTIQLDNLSVRLAVSKPAASTP